MEVFDRSASQAMRLRPAVCCLRVGADHRDQIVGLLGTATGPALQQTTPESYVVCSAIPYTKAPGHRVHTGTLVYINVIL